MLRLEISSNLLDLIHNNLCELNDMLTGDDNRYFLTLQINFSRFTYVLLLKNKSETFNVFKSLQSRT